MFTLLTVRAARTRIHSQAQRLEELAGQDMLTGLDNRLRFTDIATREAARIHRTGEESSLILMDLDRFKNVNDTYGHPVGDEVLRKAAGVIRSNVRDTAPDAGCPVEHSSQVDRAYQAADSAMYHAKRNGRNRVEVAPV